MKKNLLLLSALLMSISLSFAGENIFPFGEANYKNWNTGTFDISTQTVTLNSQWQSVGWAFSPVKDCSDFIQLIVDFEEPTTQEFGLYVKCSGEGDNLGGTVKVGSTRYIITLDPYRSDAVEAIYFFSWLEDVITVKLANAYFVSDDDGDDDIIPYEGKYDFRDNFTTNELVMEMGLGINLGNTLDATGDWINPSSILNYEQAWGSPIVTRKLIAGYAKAGYSSLRIPVSWSNMMLDNYQIHPDLMERVEKIVNWTIDYGMVAVVNVHHENEWVKKVPTDEEARKKFTAIWEQISQRFEKYGDRLMFEPMNEIGYDEIWTPWMGGQADKAKAFGYVNELNQLFVDIVRGTGGNNTKRHLLVEIYNTGLEYAYDPLTKIPTDPANRLAITVHYYTPALFAILGNGENAGWGIGVPSWGTPAEFKELNDNMDLLKKNCVDKGIPVIIGEYAASRSGRTQEAVRLYCVAVTEAIYSRGMCPMLWDVSGYQYNRYTFEFDDPVFLEETMAIPAKYPRNPSSIQNVSKPDILLYSGPGKNQLTVTSEFDSPVTVSFVSMTGRIVKVVLLSGNTIDTSSLKAGIYIVRIQNQTANYTQKIVIE